MEFTFLQTQEQLGQNQVRQQTPITITLLHHPTETNWQRLLGVMEFAPQRIQAGLGRAAAQQARIGLASLHRQTGAN